MDKLTKELVIKKHAELSCLGIAPRLYYIVSKYLDRHVTTVVKDNKFYTFKNKEYENLEILETGEEDYITYDKLLDDIAESFSLEKEIALKILSEWRRDKIIYKEMTKNVSKYWKYLSLPERI